MTTSSSLTTILLAAALALCSAPAASAAVRHAAENGTGSSCSAAAPCLLQQALDGAAMSGDEIRVHGGTHQLTTGGGLGRRLTVVGAPGEAMPSIEAQGSVGGCGLSVGPGSVARRLRIRVISTGSRAFCSYGQTILEQLVITGTHADLVGLHLDHGEWTRVDNVSIHLPTSGGRGIVVHDSSTVQLDNVSVRADDTALWVHGDGRATSVAVHNSLLDGGSTAVELTCLAVSAYAHVSAANSALGAVSEGTCAFTDSATNIGVADVNVAPDPLGALRPGAGSTLIDAGRFGEESNDRDLDGDPRVLGSRIDIGADEYRHAPASSATSATDVAVDAITLGALAIGRGAEALQARFQLGTTPAYGRTIVPPITPADPSRLLSFPTASVRVDGLAAATTYHVRTVLVNEWGQAVVGPDNTFTTTPAPNGGDPAAGGQDGGAPTSGGAGDGPVGGGSTPGPGHGGAGAGPGTGPAGGPGGERAAGPAKVAPACRVRIVRAARAGQVVLRGRCSERATLRIAVARRGRRPLVRTIVVPAARRFAKTLKLGRLATLRRSITLAARDSTGLTARPLALRIVKR
jgi:hypothetical protein